MIKNQYKHETSTEHSHDADNPMHAVLTRFHKGDCLPCKALECQNQTNLVTLETLLDICQLFPIENPSDLLGIRKQASKRNQVFFDKDDLLVHRVWQGYRTGGREILSDKGIQIREGGADALHGSLKPLR